MALKFNNMINSHSGEETSEGTPAFSSHICGFKRKASEDGDKEYVQSNGFKRKRYDHNEAKQSARKGRKHYRKENSYQATRYGKPPNHIPASTHGQPTEPNYLPSFAYGQATNPCYTPATGYDQPTKPNYPATSYGQPANHRANGYGQYTGDGQFIPSKREQGVEVYFTKAYKKQHNLPTTAFRTPTVSEQYVTHKSEQ